MMTLTAEFALRAALLGIGATLVMDAWGLFATRILRFQAPNYALVGRWIGHMPRGNFVHANIGKSAPVAGERLIGWTAHYAIGVAFAGLLLGVCGLRWAQSPTILPALAVGLVTLAAPFLLMQPGMGAGIAASRAPHPNHARLRSFLTHAIFGLGLYGTALISRALF